MLERSDVAARLPAQNLKRAKAFYADKLGLTLARKGLVAFVIDVETAGSRYSSPPAGHLEPTLSRRGRSTISRQWSRNCEGVEWFSRNMICPALRPLTALLRWKATTRVAAVSAREPPGSAIARGMCWGSANPNGELLETQGKIDTENSFNVCRFH